MEKKKLKKAILFIIQLILIGIIIYSGVHIFMWYKDNKHNNGIIQDLSSFVITEEDSENPIYEDTLKIDFTKLKEINPSIKGWLSVNGTDIEYPVVQATDNAYYLTHSLDQSYNGAGWIFADYRNIVDSTDKNIVIYGHNRRDGSMFGTLKNILKEEWYNDENNWQIKFITEKEEIIYQVFSIYKIENEEYYITTDFFDNSFGEFIETIKNRSIKDFGVQVNENDQILTLSTCDNNNKYRVVLHAKKLN